MGAGGDEIGWSESNESKARISLEIPEQNPQKQKVCIVEFWEDS